MASSPKREVYGLTIVKAPGGALVLIGGPIDLSRSESLSPRWVRELRETRPVAIDLEPDSQGRVLTKVVPVLTKVGEQVVHGESVQLMQRHLNREMGKVLNVAMLESAIELDLLEALRRPTKAAPRKQEEPRKAKRERAERAMGFMGLPDAEVRKRLLAMGRRKADVDKYLEQRRVA